MLSSRACLGSWAVAPVQSQPVHFIGLMDQLPNMDLGAQQATSKGVAAADAQPEPVPDAPMHGSSEVPMQHLEQPAYGDG